MLGDPRRDFHDVWRATGSEIARDALDRVGALYDVERKVNGPPAERRQEIRERESRERVDAFHGWMSARFTRIPAKGDLAKAMRYALNRGPSFTLFLDDGRVAIDNNVAERAVKPVGIGGKNWMFAGSDTSGETLADAMTVIETAKMSALNPEAQLVDVLARIDDHMPPKLDEFRPIHTLDAVESVCMTKTEPDAIYAVEVSRLSSKKLALDIVRSVDIMTNHLAKLT